MISIRKYLDGASAEAGKHEKQDDLLDLSVASFRSALSKMGRSGMEVCPQVGEELHESLQSISDALAIDVSAHSLSAADEKLQAGLQSWSRNASRYFQKKASEVKELLVMMARTAESVGERDKHCAQQIEDVTTQLKRIATLEDLSQIRYSLVKSAIELKTSMERISAENKAVLQGMQVQLSTYKTKLEEAEHIASYDSLTRVRSRIWVEEEIERRLENQSIFCAAVVDIDEFKSVNDEHGHVFGDELLKLFATELRSACRSTDIVGRWGGDEFIVVLDCALPDAQKQIERLSNWVCGNYTVQGTSTSSSVTVHASIGLAESVSGDNLKELLQRADAAMYLNKSESRAARAISG